MPCRGGRSGHRTAAGARAARECRAAGGLIAGSGCVALGECAGGFVQGGGAGGCGSGGASRGFLQFTRPLADVPLHVRIVLLGVGRDWATGGRLRNRASGVAWSLRGSFRYSTWTSNHYISHMRQSWALRRQTQGCLLRVNVGDRSRIGLSPC